MSFLQKIFGDPSEKAVKELQKVVDDINNLESDLKEKSDEDLQKRIREIRESVQSGDSVDAHANEVFAIVREASIRVLKMRHYDVQLIGGLVLNGGNIAEMRTGEGKTLAATTAVVLNALTGKGVHVVTVNEYLATRDAEWMGKLYSFLGLSVGVITHGQDRQSKIDAYKADITYGTNNEFGFDYLRDNMVQDFADKVQRPLHYAIVDEVDSILIDEARTPLIISAPAEKSTEEYYRFATLVAQLKENDHYNVDEKLKAATLTEEGINRMEELLGLSNIYQEKGIRTVHHIEQALKAHTIFKRDRDYVVKENEVIIVDEFTGRLMPGRRYSEGLHQAIEAKEKVEIQRESMTMATVTFQNFFRLYEKLSGMTGTAVTEAEEFEKIYGLEAIAIPTNRPIAREDANDLIYKNELAKYKAVVAKTKELTAKQQPVLIGTVSIEKNEQISSLLTAEGIQHNVLNAKNHEREAEIIEDAGKPGAVTVATNIAGRGVDIALGGSEASDEEKELVKNAGGLAVLGSERHESRRIDNQLRGRSGRQGDPGYSQFFVSTEDDLLRLFGSERMKRIMETLNIPDDMPIEHKIISRSIESAQKRVEGHNFDTRKHVVEYDDVMNKHREVIYKRRDLILEAWDYEKKKIRAAIDKVEFKEPKPAVTLREMTLEYIEKEIERIVVDHSSKEGEDQWDIEEMAEVMRTICPIPQDLRNQLEDIHARTIGTDTSGAATRTELIEFLNNIVVEQYKVKEDSLNEEVMRQIERSVLLQSIDRLWVEHLEDMAALREGIGLRGYGQRDPLVEYKKESFSSFQHLLHSIERQVVYSIYKIGVATKQEKSPMEKGNLQTGGGSKEEEKPKSEPIKKEQKIGRNDPCFCGSGKKYKKCHGKK